MSIALDADLERRIADQVESGLYASPAEVISAGLELLEERNEVEQSSPRAESAGETLGEDGLHSLWEKIRAISRTVPDEEWAKLPTDLASETDHYLYGAPKRSK